MYRWRQPFLQLVLRSFRGDCIHTGTLKRSLRLVLLFLLAQVSSVSAQARGEYANPSEGILSMEYEGGCLSIQTKEAPLERVLEEVARLAGLTVNADGPVEGRVTVHIDKLATDEAIKKILRGKDFTLQYTKRAGASKTQPFELTKVRIFLPEGDEGQARVYAYDHASRRNRTPIPRFRSRTGSSPHRPIRPGPDRDEEREPPYSPSREEAERFLSGLMQGDFDALNEVAEKLKEENPEVQDQIDQFVESLEEARKNTDEGNPIRSMQGLGNLGLIMQHMLKGRD